VHLRDEGDRGFFAFGWADESRARIAVASRGPIRDCVDTSGFDTPKNQVTENRVYQQKSTRINIGDR
jgi:hypothetical protein